MLDNLFQGVFDSNYVNVISVDKFLLCVAVSLMIGGAVAFTASRKTRLSFSFLSTLLRARNSQPTAAPTRARVPTHSNTVKKGLS